MDHRKAIETKASERYLLGEMSELERHMFEEHYFCCDNCAEEVRTGAVLVESARGVFRDEPLHLDEKEEDSRPKVFQEGGGGWLEWLRPASLIPMAAAISLAFITSYQGMVSIPALRKVAAPAMATPVVLAPATRGELPVVSVAAQEGVVPLTMYVNGAAKQLTFEVRKQDDSLVHSGSGPAPAPGAPVIVFLPGASLQTGTHRIVVRNETGTTLGEYRFVAERK